MFKYVYVNQSKSPPISISSSSWGGGGGGGAALPFGSSFFPPLGASVLVYVGAPPDPPAALKKSVTFLFDKSLANALTNDFDAWRFAAFKTA